MVFTTSTFAQITPNEVAKNSKHHYILHNIQDVDSKKIYNASLSRLNLDEYRLLHERRTITFNTGVSIELLSGDELYTKYKKPISQYYNTKPKATVFRINLTNGNISAISKN